MMPTHFLRETQPDLVVDVGANRGQFLLDVLDALPRARIIAFEPLDSEFEVLFKLHGESKRVDLRQMALGSEVGEAQMHVTAAADSSSILPIASEQTRVFPGTHQVATVTVPLSTLDKQLHGVVTPTRSLLKLDVQGAELKVLQGASSTIGKFAYVLVEASFIELYAGQPLVGTVDHFLAERGFVLDRVLSLSTVGGRAVQADFVFRNSAAGLV